MRQIKLSVCLFLLLVVSMFLLEKNVFGAFDQLIPQRQRGKFFTPSIRLRSEWNDNVSAKRGSAHVTQKPGIDTRANRRVKSYILYAEPKAQVRIPLDKTYLGVDYKYSFAYFTRRPNDNEDFAHDINARFIHKFSDRLNLDVKEDFVRQQVGTIRTHDIVVRENGSFQRNTVDCALRYDISRMFYVIGKYTNDWLNFLPYASRTTFDYLENRLGIEGDYILNKDITLLAGYDFRDRRYTLRENADYDSHMIYTGTNYRMGKYFTFDATSGVDFRKHEAATRQRGFYLNGIPEFPTQGVPVEDASVPIRVGSTQGWEENPYINLRLTTNYFKDILIILNYQYLVQTTEQTTFIDTDTQSIAAQVSYKIMPKVTVDFTAGYSVDKYHGRSYLTNYDLVTFGYPNLLPAGTVGKMVDLKNPETKSFIMGAVLSYQVTPWLFYEFGYRRTDFDSDFNTSTWERNQLFTGINAIF